MFDTKGIIGKIEDNADKVAAGLSIYGRFNGDLGRVISHYTNFKTGTSDKGALGEAILTISNPQLLKFKLWDAPHSYTGLFRGGVYAYILAELGILPAKYKGLAKKVVTGAGIAAITLPGSGEEFITHPIGNGSSASNTPSLREFYRS